MKQVTINLYEYSELSESAKEAVKVYLRMMFGTTYFKGHTYEVEASKSQWLVNGGVIPESAIIKEDNKPENPAAFPLLDPNGSFWNEGMKLRDYFAAKYVEANSDNKDTSFDSIAEQAYKMADAMLLTR